ncbi:MAG TPA: hypothetical protein VGP25_06750 [Gemmatimonadaceae bacterium]|jgi:hypothetical protein|nr:hypothetical protein [Gemmatimonadaceae bacterium]
MLVEVTEPFDDIVLDASSGPRQIHAQLQGEPLGTIEVEVSDGRVSADAIRAAVAEQFAPIVLARYLTLRGVSNSDALADELWPRAHPLADALGGVIDAVAALARRNDDGRRRGMPRRLVIDVGGRIPAFVLGRRNVRIELRLGDAVASSVEYVVGPAGIASGHALRAAAIDASAASLERVVVREALLGLPLDRTPLRERLARRVRPTG